MSMDVVDARKAAKGENMLIEEILNEFKTELSKAEFKFPGFPTDPVHAAAIVVEEAGELQRAALQFTYENGTVIDMYKEAVHTGTMALRFLYHLEAMRKRESEQRRPPKPNIGPGVLSEMDGSIETQ